MNQTIKILLEEQIMIIDRLEELGKEWIILGGVRVKNHNLAIEKRLINILKLRYEKNRKSIEDRYSQLKL